MMLWKRYKRIFKAKEDYQKELLESSFINKFKALIRLQEKALFFDKVKYKFNESFSFSKIIFILEDMIKNNVIEDYALGGATALLNYSTPHLTEDIDIFIDVKQSGLLVNLSKIYSFLVDKYDAKIKSEYLIIQGNPIQFLLPGDSLTQEAFENYSVVSIQGRKLHIFSLEYLIAIMLNLNKAKYRERLRIVKEENKFDEKVLFKILQKYKLIDKWNLIK